MSSEDQFKDLSNIVGIQGEFLGNGLFQSRRDMYAMNNQQVLFNMQMGQMHGRPASLFNQIMSQRIEEPKEKFFKAKSSLGLTVELKWVENLVGNEEDYYLIKTWGKWKPANDKWKQYIKTCMLLEE